VSEETSHRKKSSNEIYRVREKPKITSKNNRKVVRISEITSKNSRYISRAHI
jgi:hypothetical protein